MVTCWPPEVTLTFEVLNTAFPTVPVTLAVASPRREVTLTVPATLPEISALAAPTAAAGPEVLVLTVLAVDTPVAGSNERVALTSYEESLPDAVTFRPLPAAVLPMRPVTTAVAEETPLTVAVPVWVPPMAAEAAPSVRVALNLRVSSILVVVKTPPLAVWVKVTCSSVDDVLTPPEVTLSVPAIELAAPETNLACLPPETVTLPGWPERPPATTPLIVTSPMPSP